MSPLLLTLVIIEAMLTLAGTFLYVYRARLEFKEDNTLILDSAEAHLMSGQEAIHAKANQASAMLKYVGVGWVVFGVAAFGVFIAEGLGIL